MGLRFASCLILAAATAGAMTPLAIAQDQDGPLRFLRPSLPSAAEAPEATPAEAPPDSAAPAATEAEASPAEAEPSSEIGSEDDAPAQPLILRLGVIAGSDVMATMAALEPMTSALTDILGRPVEILPVSSYGAMIDMQVQQRIDGGFYSAAAYAIAEAHCACLEPIVAPAAADGTFVYHAIIVARLGSGIASADDLAGKVVAVGAADSIGARRMQLAGLLEMGVDPESFAGVRDVASAEEAVMLVLDGGAHAAFAWSSLSGDPEAGYSRGTLSDLVARGMDISGLEIVWRSSPVPHGPFAVLASLTEEERGKIETYLLELGDAEPAAYDMLSPYYGGGYVAVAPADYQALQVLAAHDVDALEWAELPPVEPVDPPED